jgi:hypothetical protein
LADHVFWAFRNADRRSFPWAGAALGERRRCGTNPKRCDDPVQGTATLTDAQAADLLAGRYYINIHTAANPAGEIRGHVHQVIRSLVPIRG